jgi:hypothetical protein
MTTAIVCSRGRGCERVELRELPVTTRIVPLLGRARGAKLSLRGIAERLGLACGHDGEPWQNVCRLAHALAKLAEFEKISHAVPDQYWIAPPREEQAARP